MTTTNEFKETDIGEIPVEWDIDEIGELFEIKQGKALSKKHREGKRPRPFLRTSNVYWGYTKISDLDEMDFTEEEEKKYELKKNDLLICEGGDIGRTAILEEDLPGIYYQNHVFRVRATKENIYPKYAMFWMDAAQNIFDHYTGTGNKTTIANLSKSRLSNYQISVPPLPEQKTIAQKLTVIRNAIEQTQAVIEATETLKKSMMKHLFTYGPVRANQTNQVKLQETEIGMVPEEWKIKKLGNIASFKNGINFKKEQKGNKGVLAIDVLNMFGKGIQPTLEGLYRVDKNIKEDYYLKNGDLLFVRSSLKREGVGWTNVFYERELNEKITYVGFIIRARLETDNINPKFLTHYFRSDIGRKNLIESSGKVAITNINQGMLGDNDIPVPNIEVQNKIVKILSEIDSKILQENQKKEALESLFNSTLESLMSAKIRVN